MTTQYSRIGWPAERVLRLLVWVIPVATLLLAWTNEQHGFYWSGINETPGPSGTRLVYLGGPWYWVHATYSYFAPPGSVAPDGEGRLPRKSIKHAHFNEAWIRSR